MRLCGCVLVCACACVSVLVIVFERTSICLLECVGVRGWEVVSVYLVIVLTNLMSM